MGRIPSFNAAYGLDVGESSRDAVNHIIFSNGINEKLIVSEYVCLLFRKFIKLDDISTMVNYSKKNPIMLGYIFELECLLRIQEYKPLMYRPIDSDAERVIFDFDFVFPLDILHTVCSIMDYSNIVIIPDKYNQPCYDFLTISKLNPSSNSSSSLHPSSSDSPSHILTAFQITISSKHKMKLKYVYDTQRDLESKLNVKFDMNQFKLHVIRPNDLSRKPFHPSFVHPKDPELNSDKKANIQNNMNVYFVKRTQPTK